METQSRVREWVEIIAKLLPGIGAVIAGIFIPLVVHISVERSRNNQLYADDRQPKREISDTELRAKMFENLIKSFFGDGPKDQSDQKKLTLLRLLALNFHEFFNLEPLYDQLESELKTREDKEKLRDISREIVGKQEAMLSQVEDFLRVPGTAYGGGIYLVRAAYSSPLAIAAGSAPVIRLVTMTSTGAVIATIGADGSAALTAGTPIAGTISTNWVSGTVGYVGLEWGHESSLSNVHALTAIVDYYVGRPA